MSSAPLIVWAVECHVPYVGSFVDSLWISKELAEAEAARRRLSNDYDEFTIEEWPIQEAVSP